jgi:hypothetical protein
VLRGRLAEWPLVRHGAGKWEGLRGDTYDGHWADDYQDGFGKLHTKFAVYDGEFLKGQRHGRGTLVAANGDWYEGDFHHDAFDGFGERSDKAGVYAGEWRDGKRHGVGTFTTHGGVRYVGQWAEGKRDGEGEQRYPDGSSFLGQWSADAKVGHGEFVDGHKATNGGEISYVGNYAEGVRHGEGGEWDGIYGDHYRGTFEGGEMQGVGKFDFVDGEEYLGCWLASGPGQMPRRMRALKRHSLAGGAGTTKSVTDNLDAKRQRDEKRYKSGGAEVHTAERIPLKEMPDAVKALTSALGQVGLGATPGAPGERRAPGSLNKRKIGEKVSEVDQMKARMSMGGGASSARAGTSAVASRMITVASRQENPFLKAGTGVVFGEGAARMDVGPRSQVPQSVAAMQQPDALKSMDLSKRFTPHPPGGPKPLERRRLESWVSTADG